MRLEIVCTQVKDHLVERVIYGFSIHLAHTPMCIYIYIYTINRYVSLPLSRKVLCNKSAIITLKYTIIQAIRKADCDISIPADFQPEETLLRTARQAVQCHF